MACVSSYDFVQKAREEAIDPFIQTFYDIQALSL